MRVHASNARTTPELHGTVSRISADVSRDQQTGATFYTIRVALPKDEIKKLENVKLIAGMQAEVFVEVNDRTPLRVLLQAPAGSVRPRLPRALILSIRPFEKPRSGQNSLGRGFRLKG